MKVIRNIAFFTIVLVSMLFTQKTVIAQDVAPVSDDEINEIAGELYCPVCENIPLDVCPTTACAQWRELIGEKIAEGWTKQQIKDYFAEQYGWNVLAVPPRTGLNWLIYILPPAVFIAGGVMVFSLIRRGKKKQTATPIEKKTSAHDTSVNVMQKIEEDLKKTDE